jgi:ABC-2 type transport system permease protein
MAHAARRLPGDLHAIWLIAQRAALEALRDRMTLLMSVFFALLLPLGVLFFLVRPVVDADETAGTVIAFYLLLVGLMPAVSAIGIAAGQFAGEKERGLLTPLLATPASNLAIFAGKVMGAVLPPLGYAAIGDTVFVIGAAMVLGVDRLRMVPLGVALSMLILVPGMTAFAATVASLVSSRVRTFNSAQQVTGFVLMPAWSVMLAIAIKIPGWGAAGLIGSIVGLMLIDGVLIYIGAATWRREEVLSHV